MLRRFVSVVLFAFFVTGPVVAGPYEDAGAAYLRGDYTLAMQLFRPLANEGDAGAQYVMGTMYDFGRGVPQDYSEALRWYYLAAGQGLAEAQFSLGAMFFEGRGVLQNNVEAARFYLMAAEQNLGRAQIAIGIMYKYGLGVLQDYAISHMWFNLAAARGEPSASGFRADVESLMTRDQIAEAQRLAREWQATHPL